MEKYMKTILCIIFALVISGCALLPAAPNSIEASAIPVSRVPVQSSSRIFQDQMNEADIDLLISNGCRLKSLERRGKFLKIVCQD